MNVDDIKDFCYVTLMDRLIAFWTGVETNQSGHRLRAILDANDDWLEYNHDWVQWLFPLPEPSLAVPESPVLTPLTVACIRNNVEIKALYWEAVGRVSSFYSNTDVWLRYTDHNHKRITRILRSMKLVLGWADAMLFYEHIKSLTELAGNPVSPHNTSFWDKELDL